MGWVVCVCRRAGEELNAAADTDCHEPFLSEGDQVLIETTSPVLYVCRPVFPLPTWASGLGTSITQFDLIHGLAQTFKQTKMLALRHGKRTR